MPTQQSPVESMRPPATHRLEADLEDFLEIEQTQPKSLLVDDDGYEDGDCIRIAYHKHDDLKWLLVRTVQSVIRDAARLEPGTCIITIA